MGCLVNLEALQPLSTVRAGATVTVRALSSGSDSCRLNELGIGAGRTVRVVSSADPFVCEVGECRFGMCRRLARCVLVEPPC